TCAPIPEWPLPPASGRRCRVAPPRTQRDSRPPPPLPPPQVTREVAENVEFPADPVRPRDSGGERPEQHGHLGPIPEEGQHVAPLGQLILARQPRPELFDLLAAKRVVEGDLFELLHPTLLPARYRSRNRRKVSSPTMSNSSRPPESRTRT